MENWLSEISPLTMVDPLCHDIVGAGSPRAEHLSVAYPPSSASTSAGSDGSILGPRLDGINGGGGGGGDVAGVGGSTGTVGGAG